jgi:hypothetical protein
MKNEQKDMTAFDKLLDRSTFSVMLQGDIPVLCRRLPFSTMMYIIQQVATSMEADLSSIRKSIVDGVVEALAISKSKQKDDDEEPLAIERPKEDTNIEGVLKALMTALAGTPTVLRRILHDTIVGVTDEVLDTLTLEDAILVMDGVFSRIDKDVLAAELDRLFFGCGAVLTAASERMSRGTGLTIVPDQKVPQHPARDIRRASARRR